MASNSRTQVGIIGAGPAGLMLARLLHLKGIDCIILENRSREYVEARVRAGLLEHNTVEQIKEVGLAENMLKEGIEHHGVNLSFEGKRTRIPFQELTNGRSITIYGQRKVVRDFIAGNIESGIPILFEAAATDITNIEGDKPVVHYIENGEEKTITCDFVAGCDGYHGIGRTKLPEGTYKTHRIEYPFGWLGILAEVAPSSEELIYAFHENGFALHSYRSPSVSRLYIQVDQGDDINNWPDEKIWDELSLRLGTEGWELERGPVLQKGITPMRSYMIDHMQFGNLFVAGDAAHIVPPTGGKGLNLAVADVKIMSQAFETWYQKGDRSKLNTYSADCLGRVWRTQDFSNFMTTQFHKISEYGSFDYELQKARFDYICKSKAMAATIAENYTGLAVI